VVGIVIAASALRSRGKVTLAVTSNGIARSATAARMTARTWSKRERIVFAANGLSAITFAHD
jgi:hypothetical protein